MFSLIIPTFNEKENIKPLLDKVTNSLENIDYEIIIVDDDSPDGTGVEVMNYSTINKRVRLIVRKKNKGLSSAVIKGFERAKGELLGVMDADLSHDPSILPSMIKELENNDLVVGTRSKVVGWPLKRKIISSGASTLAKLFLGVKLTDPMSGYFALRKNVFERVKDDLNPVGYKILLEIYYHAKPLRVAEAPFVFNDRVNGESKLTSGVMKDYLKQLMSLKFRNY